MIRSLLVALSIFCAPMAHAEVMYRCEFTANSKTPGYTNTYGEWKKVAYLSQNRENKIEFGGHPYNTTLRVQVGTNGELSGFVNGQYKFILDGSVQLGGRFESASAKGTIKCEAAKDYPVAFIFMPWKAIFIDGDKDVISSWHPYSAVELNCLIGDQEKARKIVADGMKISIDRVVPNKVDGLDVTLTTVDCLKWEGTGREDMYCVKQSAPYEKVHTMFGCDYEDPNSDNR